MHPPEAGVAGPRQHCRSLKRGACQLFHQLLPIVGGFETDRHILAFDGNLRRQADLYFRRVLRGPLLEAGQLVRAADGECVAVFEGHRDRSMGTGRRWRARAKTGAADKAGAHIFLMR